MVSIPNGTRTVWYQPCLMCTTLGAPHTEMLAELMQLCSGELCYTIPDRCGLFSSDLKASLQLV